MKLRELAKSAAHTAIRFLGAPEETSIADSKGDLYFVWKLKQPVTVRCSTDPDILPQEVDELYLRASSLDLDIDGDDKDGYFLKNADGTEWRADFSTNQNICIYQETSIRQWARDNRTNNATTRRVGINEKIKARQEAKNK